MATVAASPFYSCVQSGVRMALPASACALRCVHAHSPIPAIPNQIRESRSPVKHSVHISFARVLASSALAIAVLPWPSASAGVWRDSGVNQDESDQAEWTLMFYMDSDNNLEAAQLEDLREMIAVGSTPEVNIIALVDRAASADEDDGYSAEPIANLKNWESAKVLFVEKGRLHQLDDWGEVNMGNPATLERFVSAAIEGLPAKRYGLVFGDHGAAWPGACSDDSHDDDLLSLVEIGSSLSALTKGSGPLELIGFDACLMANLEVAHAVAPSAHILIASEELEPGDGWNYTPLLNALVANPRVNGAQFGRVAADTFHAFYNDSSDDGEQGLGITLSVIALDRIPALATAVNALGDRCDRSIRRDGRDAWLDIADAVSDTEEYGASSRGEPGSAVFDLKNLAERIKRNAPDLDTAAAADLVIRAVSETVLYRVRGSARANSNGLSIFCPPDSEALLQSDPIPYSSTSFGRSGAWAKFLASYTGVADSDSTAPELSDVQSDDADVEDDPGQGGEDVVTITSTVKADDLDTADFVLAIPDGDDQLVLGQVPAGVDEKGRLHEEWDGGWFTIGNSKTELVCPITEFDQVEDEDGIYFVKVPAQVRPRGAVDWDDVTLFFFLTFADDGSVIGEFVYAFEDTDAGPREYELDAGDSVRPVFLLYEANGDESYVASDEPEDILKLASLDDLTVGYSDVDDGDYLIGFVVTDFAGNVSEDYVEVRVGGEPPSGAVRRSRSRGHDVAWGSRILRAGESAANAPSAYQYRVR